MSTNAKDPIEEMDNSSESHIQDHQNKNKPVNQDSKGKEKLPNKGRTVEKLAAPVIPRKKGIPTAGAGTPHNSSTAGSTEQFFSAGKQSATVVTEWQSATGSKESTSSIASFEKHTISYSSSHHYLPTFRSIPINTFFTCPDKRSQAYSFTDRPPWLPEIPRHLYNDHVRIEIGQCSPRIKFCTLNVPLVPMTVRVGYLNSTKIVTFPQWGFGPYVDCNKLKQPMASVTDRVVPFFCIHCSKIHGIQFYKEYINWKEGTFYPQPKNVQYCSSATVYDTQEHFFSNRPPWIPEQPSRFQNYNLQFEIGRCPSGLTFPILKFQNVEPYINFVNIKSNYIITLPPHVFEPCLDVPALTPFLCDSCGRIRGIPFYEQYKKWKDGTIYPELKNTYDYLCSFKRVGKRKYEELLATSERNKRRKEPTVV